MPAHHIQPPNRRVRTNALAVARKLKRSLFRSAFVSEPDMNQAHGLLGSSASRPSDARDAEADVRACAPPDALRKGNRNFRADSPFCLAHVGGHAGPSRFQIVAIANDAAKKICR